MNQAQIQPVATVRDPTKLSFPDGQDEIILSAGKGGELLSSEVHARYAELTLAGRMFCARTPHAGATIPVYTTTTPSFMLLNPGGSGVKLELVSLQINMLAAAEIVSSFALNHIHGAVIMAAISITGQNTIVANGVQNLLLGKGKAPKSSLLSASHVWVNQLDNTLVPLRGFMKTTKSPNVFADLAGSIVVPPDTMVCLVSVFAQTQASMISLTYAEVPV
jgi:hypothetical protein